jgi:hypothetical protein
MASKTFTSGEILTAADTNTYLANSGLVLVKTQTVGSGVSSVIVTDAFSATYDNYLVRVDEVQYSVTDDSVTIQVRTGTTTSATNYLYALPFARYNGTTGLAASTTGTGFINLGRALAANDKASFLFNINQPFLPLKTTVSTITVGSDLIGSYGGYHNVAASYNQFVVSTSGTMTGGTIRVYGYRS